MTVTPAEAAREILKRRQARRSLIGFTEYTNPAYRTAPHHTLIAERLEAVERGEIDRLAIFMPPRHGKSELVSRRFPAWLMGKDPSRQIIAASYSAELAQDFGRDVRDLVGSAEFAAVFPGVSLAADSAAAGRWNSAQGGSYVAVGVGGSITGRGAHIGIIDDPLKDRQEADSEVRRAHVKGWYQSTFYTRLMPPAAVVLCQTRWHEDDLAGWLLAEAEKGGDRWEILDLPALAANGEALWPDRYPVESLERIRRNVGPREWSALYQQKPQPDEGTYFQRAWFKRHVKRPPDLAVYGTSDYAVTDDGGDYTVHRVWGVDPEGALYLLSGWRGQTASDKWIDAKLDLIAAYKPLCWFGEAGVIQKAIEPMLVRRMRERGVYCRLEWVPSIHDKPTRARGFQARASMGMVSLPEGPEGDAILDEYLRFPAGKHDDDVDCASLIGRALDEAHPGVHTIPKPEEPVDRWKQAARPQRQSSLATL